MRYLVSLFLFFNISTAYGQDNSIDSYGDLFLVEEKIALDGSIEQFMSIGSVVNHSVYNVTYFRYEAAYYFNNFFNYGADVIYNHIYDRQFFTTVSGVIEDDGEVVVRYPEYGGHLFLGFTPIKGSLNWLNTKNYSFYLLTKFGVGLMRDVDENRDHTSYFAAVTLKFEVTKSWGFLAGMRQQNFIIEGRQEQSTALETGAVYLF